MELQALHGNLKSDDFLGKGSLTVSEISSSSPSRCAVADGCTISVDRRLTAGETEEDSLQQIRALPAVTASGAQVSVYECSETPYPVSASASKAFFPAWVALNFSYQKPMSK